MSKDCSYLLYIFRSSKTINFVVNMDAKETVNQKCAKCGVTSKEDPTLTFHRFPQPSMHGSLKAKVWATFCFPDESWTSDESLVRLYKQHKMLCGKHFDNSSFTSDDRMRLNKFAIPTDAKDILAGLRGEQHSPSQQSDTAKQEEAEASTSQNIFCVCPKDSNDTNPERPTLPKQAEAEASTSQNIFCVSPEDSNDTNPERPTLTKEKRGKSFLEDLDIKTKLELTPKMYKRWRHLSETIRLRSKLKTLKKSKKSISTLINEGSVNKLIQSKLTPCLLLQSQLKNVARKRTGQRWTLDDKIFALSIYKKSSACYRFLRRLICLPSPSSLKKLLNRIPLVCGINQQIKDTIKKNAKNRLPDENLCILAFDEIYIRKHIYYNSKLDKIDAYQHHANQGRKAEIVTQALTFMAVGLKKPWKQPIAFYFSVDPLTADKLAVLIKEVLDACFSAGLRVMGTVCDLDGVNIDAINLLGSSRDQPFFNFQGHEIVTILDPPHLLKCFRNNFMKHDIEFTLDLQTEEQQVQGVAKWSHIEKFFEVDHLNPHFVFAPALTKQHLQPNGKQKKKVSLAAQVLSHKVAGGLYARCGSNELPPEAEGTANVVAHMDKLFDAMNGDTPNFERGKSLRRNMSSSSPHLQFFAKMKRFFAKMKFVGARSRPPSQDGWLWTLNAIERIFRNLRARKIKTLSVKRLNLDPLENCFEYIKTPNHDCF